MTETTVAVPPSAPFERRDLMLLVSAMVVAAIAAFAARLLGAPKLQAICGLIVILSVAYALSTNRRAIDRRTIAWGLTLQVVFALIVLKTTAGRETFAVLGSAINRLLSFAGVGAAFVFGPMGDKTVWGRIMTA